MGFLLPCESTATFEPNLAMARAFWPFPGHALYFFFRRLVNQSLRRFLTALLLAIVVYGVFVVYTGYQSLSSALSQFSWRYFGFAIALSCFNYILRFLKWEFYLAKLQIRGVHKFESLLIFLSGFVLTVTPGKIGEVFKSAVLHETHGVDPARTAPIVLAERLTDVIAIVVLIALGSLGFSGGLIWALVGGVAVLSGLVLLAWPLPLQVVIRWMKSRPGTAARLAPRVETAQKSLRIVASPTALIVPTLLSIVGWGAEGYSLWLLLQGFGATASVSLAMFFYATATLAGALVPVPGGLGVAEGLIQSQLVEIGQVESGAATGAMLMIRFATLWWAVLVGFAALGVLRLLYPKLFVVRREGRDLIQAPGD